MSKEDRDILLDAFPQLKHIFPQLEDPEDNQAVLLISKDDSSEAFAGILAGLYSKSPILFRESKISEEEWEKKTDMIANTGQQINLFAGSSPERLCLVVTRLDQRPKWLIYHLKSLLENAARKYLCIASATDFKKIPALLSSHFHRVEYGKGKRKRVKKKATHREG
ncbi:MAG: hypothetical protein GXY44_04500 [Phycisphaerales bacterium]|nr:hypothetical protein [Phycisphaerales bacterium]